MRSPSPGILPVRSVVNVVRERESSVVKVKVRTFAQFREILGAERVLSGEDGMSFRGLLETLAERIPGARDILFEEDGAIRDYVIMMRNGRRIDRDDAQNTILCDGDEVALFPPVSGG
jgi:molybdopterin synthase sulfur carrier subunit